MQRREFIKKAALALPAASLFSLLENRVASAAGKVRITGMKLKPISRVGHTIIRIDTDQGISGFGESGVTGAMMTAWRDRYFPVLKDQDPTAIAYHFHRMSTLMHTYMANIPALSGIDMALWDLAGKLIDRPVYQLLGGPFRETVPFFINSEPGNMLDKGSVEAWAARFKAQPQGFKATKINTHNPLKIPMGRYTKTLHARDVNIIQTCFENVRDALGFDYDIMVHCHNEYDLPSSIAMARAVEGIKPAWFEDPLPPAYSDSWFALKRDCNVPILTGEKLSMPNQYHPFLKNRAVDYLYPDLAFCGGITAFNKIASLAELYRIPVATHNVGGILLTMASIHAGLSVQNFYTSEGRLGGRMDVLSMAKNPPVITEGNAAIPTEPGLGVDLDEAGVRQWQSETDPADWI